MSDPAPSDLPAEDVIRILNGPADEALALLQKLAGNGVVEAQVILGQWLLEGRGGAVDRRTALHWFLTATHSGDAMALNMAGRCYDNGWGTQEDPDLATQFFRRAADKGLDWGLYNYATALTLGRGVDADRAQAFALYRRAAGAGHAKSLNIVGGFYEDGWEVEKDLAVARDYYRRAAEGGDFRGHFNLGRFLAEDGDLGGAMTHFREAARCGTPSFREKLDAFLAGRNLTLEDSAP